GPDGVVPAWMLEPGAFKIDGAPLAERASKEDLHLAPGTKLALDVDLGALIAASKAFAKHDFKLEHDGGGKPMDVHVLAYTPVTTGLDYASTEKMSPADLAQYHVVLLTNRGSMEVELWPDVAPGHVRNFLDLAQSGFYDGTLFHRVGPGFMIQGGDPL